MKNIKNVVLAAGAALALLAVGLVPSAHATGAQSDYNLNDTWLLSWGTQKAAIYGSSPSNWVRVWVNGADHSAFTTTGLGIGTDAPTSKLDVVGNGSIGSYAGVTAAPANGLSVSGVTLVGTSTPQVLTAFEVGSTTALRVKQNGWVEGHQNQAPTIASCGQTGGSNANIANGTDQFGDVTLGAATTCTVIFAEVPSNVPHCTCSDRTTAGVPCYAQAGATDVILSGTTTAPIIAKDTLDWVCFSHQ